MCKCFVLCKIFHYLAKEIILTDKKGGCYEKDFYSISTATISIVPETKVKQESMNTQ